MIWTDEDYWECDYLSDETHLGNHQESERTKYEIAIEKFHSIQDKIRLTICDEASDCYGDVLEDHFALHTNQNIDHSEFWKIVKEIEGEQNA